jgi:hypothetical protein
MSGVELILFKAKNKHYLALVDGESFSVSVKQIHGDAYVAELLKNDRARQYSGTSPKIPVAIDYTRGVLFVSETGGGVMTFSEFLNEYENYESEWRVAQLRGYTRACTSAQRLAEMHATEPKWEIKRIDTSFYACVRAFENAYGVSLFGKCAVGVTLREKLFAFTGADIYKGENTTFVMITPSMLHIDRIDVLMAGDKSVVLEIRAYGNSSIKELYTSAESVTLRGTHGTTQIDSIFLGTQAQTLILEGIDCKRLSCNGMSELKSLNGLSGEIGGLGRFTKLTKFENCWNGSEKNLCRPYVEFTDTDGLEFKNCFNYCDLSMVLPFAKQGGAFDITGIESITRSFCECTGFKTVTGRAGVIEHSFFLNESYDGCTFNVVTQKFHKSFCGESWDYGYVCILACDEDVVLTLNIDTSQIFNCVEFIFDIDDEYESVTKPTIAKIDVAIADSHEGVIDLRINVPVHTARLSVPTHVDVELRGNIQRLLKASCVLKDVVQYGPSCFVNVAFQDTHILELDDTLEFIGQWAFARTKNISNIVIPRSVTYIGSGAFTDAMSSTGVETIICVYRGSYAHEWSRKKRLRVLVIDCVSEVPPRTPDEAPSDYAAAFVDIPEWAKKSAGFLARLKLAEFVDVQARFVAAGEISAESLDYLHAEAITEPSVHLARMAPFSKDTRKGSLFSESEGYYVRWESMAHAYNRVFGSNLEFLDILDRFKWTKFVARNIIYWRGEPLAVTHGASSVEMYTKGNKLLYVGCARVNMIRGGETVLEPFSKVLYSTSVIGPELNGKLVLAPSLRLGVAVTVFNEPITGEYANKVLDFFNDGTMLVHKARGEINTTLLTLYKYSLVGDTIYKFSQDSKGDEFFIEEISVEDFQAEIKPQIKSAEAKLLALPLIAPFLEAPVCEADICFEMESRPLFALHSETPDIDGFLEFLLKSSLTRRASVRDGIAGMRVIAQNAKGDKIVQSESATRTKTFVLKDGKTYGFVSVINPVNLAYHLDKINACAVVKRPVEYNEKLEAADVFVISQVNSTVAAGLAASTAVAAFDLARRKLVFGRPFYYTRNTPPIKAFKHMEVLFALDSVEDLKAYYASFGESIFKIVKDGPWCGINLTTMTQDADSDIQKAYEYAMRRDAAAFQNTLGVIFPAAGIAEAGRHLTYCLNTLKYARI